MGEKMLGDSEYLLMSDVNPNSFDARYFGLIVSLQIQHVVEPVFTWGY
ncbi:MAG: S26 family signal peptidase [Deltaproteobacteria bacterium]|nr:S26 family signal peptidase [Deltaproteobacteria bacterium]